MSASDLIEHLEAEHRAMLELVQQFRAADFERSIAGSDWTALDVFAHLAHGSSEAVKALADLARGQPISMGIDREHAGKPGRGMPLARIMEEFRRSHRSLVDALKRVPSGSLRAETAQRTADGASMNAAWVVAHVIEHYAAHYEALSGALDTPD
ncbi:MAG: maleylpyruvate isomerase N-terminal domain-containing protein [Chloroflexi bacterium]|nr:maleylpyruvate isomerase N-terminal domain-containing protein [Chloroflexota bacterium]